MQGMVNLNIYPVNSHTTKVNNIVESNLYKILKNTQANHINFKKLGELKKKTDKNVVNNYQVFPGSNQSSSKQTSR